MVSTKSAPRVCGDEPYAQAAQLVLFGVPRVRGDEPLKPWTNACSLRWRGYDRKICVLQIFVVSLSYEKHGRNYRNYSHGCTWI